MTCTATDVTSDMRGGDELIAAGRGVRPARAASGLGLAIVHGLVDANRGEIRFDTSASGGLLTEIRLPLTPTSPPVPSHGR